MEKVKIQLIRNATVKIHYAGQVLLVDPMLGEKHTFMSFVVPNQNLNPTVDLTLSTEEILQDVDTLLLTHAHPDHFDPPAIAALNKDLAIYIQEFDKESVEKAGFNKISVVQNTAQHNGIMISKTDGKHGPDALLSALGQVSGFVLQADNQPTIYIVGDCLWASEIEAAIEKYNPDIIITNSGGARFMGDSQILMDEQDTIKVAQKAPQATVVAVHMNALDHCKTTRTVMRDAVKNAAVNVLIPEDGELIEL